MSNHNLFTDDELNKAIQDNEENGFKVGIAPEFHNDITWGDYKDHEKRAMSFTAGVHWLSGRIADRHAEAVRLLDRAFRVLRAIDHGYGDACQSDIDAFLAKEDR